MIGPGIVVISSIALLFEWWDRRTVAKRNALIEKSADQVVEVARECAVLNADDQRVRGMAPRTAART